MAGGAAPGGGGGQGNNQKNFKKRHPDSSYETKYPYNRVMVTESGHEMHWDDTKGKERIRLGHMSGSYMELSPGGRRVEMTVGHRVEYNKGGVTQTSDKNWDVKMKGSHRKSVSGDAHEETLGTHSSAVAKDRKQITGGDVATATGGDFKHGCKGDHLLTIGGASKIKADKGQQIKVTGDASDETSGKKLISAKEITLKADLIVLESGDIRLGSRSASRELGLKDTLDTSMDKLAMNLSTAVKAI